MPPGRPIMKLYAHDFLYVSAFSWGGAIAVRWSWSDPVDQLIDL
jgi:hypothetical protein